MTDPEGDGGTVMMQGVGGCGSLSELPVKKQSFYTR